MRGHHRSALIACTLTVAGLGTALLNPAALQRATAGTVASSIPPNSVTVAAGGDVHIAPDMATVTCGVMLKRDSAQDAQQSVNAVIAAAVRNLRALGIADRQIQTADMSLNPSYDDAGTVTGYQASQTLSIVVTSLRLVGRVVDAGVTAHANSNVSITFGLRDENAARNAALAQAVGVARARAAAAAAALGRSLNGAHVQLSETSQPVPRPVTYDALRAPSQAAAPTQAFGGLLTVHEDVTLTYTY